MESYKVLFTKGASEDFLEIAEWYAEQSLSASQKFVKMIGNWVTLLQQNPWAGVVALWFCRKIVLKDFPYCLYYKVNETENTVEIIALIHQKRGIKTLKKILQTRTKT